MLDRDLADLYGVPTKAFNQAVKRHADRFPGDFMFQLTMQEARATPNRLRSQSVTLKRGQHIKYRPNAFTEHGILMLSKSWANSALRIATPMGRWNDAGSVAQAVV